MGTYRGVAAGAAVAVVAVMAGWGGGAGAQSQAPPPYALAEPGISPDGREIAFSSGGDIWSVSATGGEARLLVADAGFDRRPLFSPDGRYLAFVSSRTGGGDVYLLTLATGDVRRLTWDDGLDQLDAWAPDSASIFFSSTGRDIAGMNDIFRVSVEGGTPMPVTEDRYVNEFGAAPAPDGRQVAFVARGIGSTQWWRKRGSHIDESELWMWSPGSPGASSGNVPPTSAPPARYAMLAPRGARQMWPMWNGDGRTLFYVSDRRDGVENLWARTLPATLPASAFVTVSAATSTTETDPPATGVGSERPLTSFRDGRVLWPSITRDGRTIAFERAFGVWTLDTSTGQARPLTITRRGASVSVPPERIRQTNQFEHLALAPDGRKIAFVARGDVWAASARDAGDATRLTTTLEIESQPVWSPDSRRVVYASARGAGQQLYEFDLASGRETALTRGTTTDLSPAFSPDGRRLAFLRDRARLCVIDLTTSTERVLATGIFGDTLDRYVPMWSPDGAWIAVLMKGAKAFTNVALVPVEAGGPPRPVSFLANAFAASVAWTRDGTSLYFDSGQRTEPGQLVRVDLTPRTPRFREDLFRDLFVTPASPSSPSSPASPASPAPANPATPSTLVSPPGTPLMPPPATPPTGPPATPPAAPPPTAPLTTPPGAPSVPASPATTPGSPPAGSSPARIAPVVVDFANIRERLSLVPTGLDVDEVTIAPDGKTAIVVASAAGQQNLYAWSLDELSAERPVARQLTTTVGAKADPQVTPDSREVYYLDAGRVQIVNIERRESRALAVTAEFTTDFASERLQIFRQAWTLLRDNFYDAAFNGVDWNASAEVYGQRAGVTSSPDELRRLMSLMLGDLNASHLGISAAGPPAAIGRLGVQFDSEAYRASGQFRVASVVPLGPAALTRDLRPGDVITAINGEPLTARTNLDERLAHTIDRRVLLQVRSAAGTTREVAIRPTNQATEKSLLYRAWITANRDYVLARSGGRLGYVHMINMSQAALDQLHIDLDAENHIRDGVVIDLRNNNGGFVNAYALDVFSRQPYLRMSTRGVGEAPARVILGQRALESPTILVTNQHSLSDAEDFTEGYRAMKIGTIVGEPTAGWIIYTWDTRLVDGSTLRLPRMRVRGADGQDMEGRPRPVDVAVGRPLGETSAGTDTQLDAAIRLLLRRLGRAE